MPHKQRPHLNAKRTACMAGAVLSGSSHIWPIMRRATRAPLQSRRTAQCSSMAREMCSGSQL